MGTHKMQVIIRLGNRSCLWEGLKQNGGVVKLRICWNSFSFVFIMIRCFENTVS